jgi:hypothetical protein
MVQYGKQTNGFRWYNDAQEGAFGSVGSRTHNVAWAVASIKAGELVLKH